MQLHDQQVHLGSWEVPQPLRSRVSSQWMVPEFCFSSPSLKRLMLVWSPRTLVCNFGEAQKALLAVLRSPSRQQKGLESERQTNQEFQVFVHVAGSATRVLSVSQHTQRLLMSAVLWVERTLELRETVGDSRPPLHDEWTCARCRTAGSGQLRHVPPREQCFSGRPQKKALPQGAQNSPGGGGAVLGQLSMCRAVGLDDGFMRHTRDRIRPRPQASFRNCGRVGAERTSCCQSCV